MLKLTTKKREKKSEKDRSKNDEMLENSNHKREIQKASEAFNESFSFMTQ
jgi:hypothetical protein